MSKVADIINGVMTQKLKDKKGSISGIVVLDISGSDGGCWTVDCDGATVEKKDDAAATVRIKMLDTDFVDMMNGDLNPATAMFTGKIKIEGDMALASKLAMAIK